jgi:aspartate dehydrogenase
MRKTLKIGIIGCGAIGTSLTEFIRAKLRGKAVVCCLYDIDRSKALQLSKKLRLNSSCITGSRAVLIRKSDLVVEAASAASSLDIAMAVVSAGKDVMVMSVGGIVAGIGKLRAEARRKGCRVYVPSGAVSGVDAAKSAAIAGIRTITLTTRKPPKSFESVAYVTKKKIELGALRRDTVLLEAARKKLCGISPRISMWQEC